MENTEADAQGSSPYRGSRPEVFCKKGVLGNFAKFTGKHLCQSPFFNKLAGLRAATLLKKRLWHRCFPVIFLEFLRTPFFTEHHPWLLLTVFTIKHAFPMLVLFQPFFLIIKGEFVTSGKIYLCVKSHSFVFSLIPCCPLSFKTELWYLRLSLQPILQIR